LSEIPLKDHVMLGAMWGAYYGGLEPKSVIGDFLYDRKLKKRVQAGLA